MAPGTSPPNSRRKKASRGRREREFLRYSHCLAGLHQSTPDDVAKSSPDAALTAFAQLVALRLNCRRAMISLFDAKTQYVIAEATRTLSLQIDTAHAPGDELWLGRTTYPRNDGLGALAVQSYEDAVSRVVGSASRTTCIIPDLRHNARTSSKPCVVGAPFAQFYAGAPIVSPAGYAIGSICCYGDDPRPLGLSEAEQVFMGDIATTVMVHLEMARIEVEHARSVDMLKGLSRFMEGQHDLDDSRPTTGTLKPETSPLRVHAHKVLHVLQAHTKPQQESGVNESTSRRTQAFATSNINERNDGYSVTSSRPYSPTTAAATRSDLASSVCTVDIAKPALLHDDTKVDGDLQEALLSNHVRSTFERAARIIQRSMDVSGVFFLDASDGQVGGLRSPRQRHSESSETSDSNTTRKDSRDGTKRSKRSASLRSPSTVERPCRILGAAWDEEDIGFTPSSKTRSQLTESFLRSLLRRFPYGKVWNFDKDGFTSSDEFSDESVDASDGSNTRSGSHRIRGTDSAMFHNLLPGVRSLAIVPMWDSLRERFFAGTVVWTYSPIRILTFHEDLNYLGAFCDVIQAEIGRLDAHAEVQAKTSFVSSISHELRSPLHGILGGVEFLQNSFADGFHKEMIHMIDVCGRSLLDIIDNVLEITKISSYNRSIKTKPTDRPGRRRRRSLTTPMNEGKAFSEMEDVQTDLALVTEEVFQAALWSSSKPFKGSTDSTGKATVNSNEPPVKVMLDVDDSNLHNQDWRFLIEPGAWRRIVLHLISNSLKFTDAGGFISVKLWAAPPLGSRSAAQSMIYLAVEDSGRGMSHEYLTNGLWKPFSQEDTNVQGTGLGLSLVHSIVRKAGGKIELQSDKGIGTTVIVSLPLVRSIDSAVTTPVTSPIYRGMNCVLIGLEVNPHAGSRSARAANILRATLIATCERLGLHVMSATDDDSRAPPDIYLIAGDQVAAYSALERTTWPRNVLKLPLGLEDDVPASRISEPSKSSRGPASPSSVLEVDRRLAQLESPFLGKACIVLCDAAVAVHATTEASNRSLQNAAFLPQPFGPRAFEEALKSCLEKASMYAKEMEDSDGTNLSSQYTSESDTEDQELTSRPNWYLARTPRYRDISGTSSRMLGTPAPGQYRGAEFPFPSPSTTEARSLPVDPPVVDAFAPPEARKQTLLLVDDNDVNLRLLVMYVRRKGYHYITATNGLEALNAYKTGREAERDENVGGTMEAAGSESSSLLPQRLQRPNVVLMDATMPKMDGFTATRYIRNYEQEQGLEPATIIALTALTSADAQQEAYSSGCDVFLTKPVKLKELGRLLDEQGLRATENRSS